MDQQPIPSSYRWVDKVLGVVTMIVAGWRSQKRQPDDDDLDVLEEAFAGWHAFATQAEREAALLAATCDVDVDPGPPVEPYVDPIPMVLHCPGCGTQHLDGPNIDEGWTNPIHRSHLCAACGVIWRPADVPTVGVAAIATRGQQDTNVLTGRAGVDADWTTERGRWVSPKAVRLITRTWEADRRMALKRRDEVISDLLQAIDILRLQAIVFEGVLPPGAVQRLSTAAHRARLMRR